jgi:hypothetical protein
MMIGAKKEAAVLNAFSKLTYVKGVFECGLLENKQHPWMAASPDGAAVVKFNDDQLIVASVEVKTRVAVERAEEAKKIASKYQYKLITCDIGDDTWNECVEREHSTQVILQLWVMKLQTAFYIVTLPGTSTSSGKIVYVVTGNLTLQYANSFFDQYMERVEKLLLLVYRSTTVDQVVKALPKEIEPGIVELLKTRWPFFTAIWKYALESSSGFPPCNIYKTSFQTLYNCLKDGLDANTQQMASITTGCKVGFEQKYVLRLLTAIVTNAWCSFQLLQYDKEIETMTFTKVKEAIN